VETGPNPPQPSPGTRSPGLADILTGWSGGVGLIRPEGEDGRGAAEGELARVRAVGLAAGRVRGRVRPVAATHHGML
jgi:hypothetical protein